MRLSVRGLRGRLRPLRTYIVGVGALVGLAGVYLVAWYDDLDGPSRLLTIFGIGGLTLTVVLLTAAPVRLRWARMAGRPEPTLPAPDGLFRGRRNELAHLQAVHDAARAQRARDRKGRRKGRKAGVSPEPESPRPARPVIIAIHGKPGVGKRELAMELGRHLAHRYPHGQLHVNLGTVRGALEVGDVLGKLLQALGWPPGEIPPETSERQREFLHLVKRRDMLIVLVAARNEDQVLPLLLVDARCTVIVTSRRDLSDKLGTTSFALDVPRIDDAVSILRAASGTDDENQPECAARIVEYCGGLPLALRAAAGIVRPGTDLAHVADLLAEPSTRLQRLERPDSSVLDRIDSGYQNLLPREQRALQLLTVVASSSFLPWVLVPLLGVTPREAENVMARLGDAQLLDDVGRDEATGLARYAFHPLVRLYAEARRVDADAAAVGNANEGGDGDADAAPGELDRAYREVIAATIAHAGGQAASWRPPQRYLPPGSTLPRRLAQRSEALVRTEHGSLVRTINLAHDAGLYPLCWQIAGRLNGYLPTRTDVSATLVALDRATLATEEGGPLDQIGVLLAKGAFLVSLEQYTAGIDALTEVVLRAENLRADGKPEAAVVARYEVCAQRRIGEAYLQMAAYGSAATAFDKALRLVRVDDRAEQRLIELLIAETRQIDPPPRQGGEGSAWQFNWLLMSADSAGRRKAWPGAQELLAEAEVLAGDDARRLATVRYRTALLLLDQHQHQHGDGPPAVRRPGDDPMLADLAARRCAEALLIHERMGNALGVVRCRCLLVRCQVAAGRLVAAERTLYAAREGHEILARPENDAGLAPVKARLRRAEGALLLGRHAVDAGRQALFEAAVGFAEQHDWAAEQETLRYLERMAVVRFGCHIPA